MDLQFLLDLRNLKAISNYQFDFEISDIIFKNSDNLRIVRSKNTDKIRYVYNKDILLLTLKPNNGLFTLSLSSAQLIINEIKPPRLRVIVQNDISDFIKQGRNVFCKHIIEVDEKLRPLDEVIIVNENDELLAIGRLKLPVPCILAFNTGVAVNVRKGISKLKS